MFSLFVVAHFGNFSGLKLIGFENDASNQSQFLREKNSLKIISGVATINRPVSDVTVGKMSLSVQILTKIKREYYHRIRRYFKLYILCFNLSHLGKKS